MQSLVDSPLQPGGSSAANAARTNNPRFIDLLAGAFSTTSGAISTTLPTRPASLRYRCVRNRGDFTCCKAKCAFHQKHAALLAWQPTDSALQPFRGIACCKRKATTPACHHCQSHQSNWQPVVIELESSHEKSYERFPRCRFSLLKIAQIEL